MGSNASQKYSDLNAKFLSRPARKQKDFVDPKKYHTEGANEYNLWYGRYMGDMNDKADREPAADRCVLEKDAGYTKADQGNAQQKGRRFFCIHFAHGMCAKGADCIFHHRIPLPEDDRQCDELFDIFGRSRHSKHKDDMSGVGSFMKPCRTLFVGNLLKSQYRTPKELEEALWRHFGEWGELENLNVIHRLSIAFPRYRLRTSAGEYLLAFFYDFICVLRDAVGAKPTELFCVILLIFALFNTFRIRQGSDDESEVRLQRGAEHPVGP